MDATTFTVNTPNSDQYYGAVNTADPSGQWVHSWGVSQNNLPDHAHTIASFETEVVVNVDPNTGYSLTDGTQDDGYIYVSFNGTPVGDPIVVPAGTTADTWLGGTQMSNAQQEGWQITTSDNVFIKIDGGNIQQGTSAGLANGVEADRGGQDGSVQMKLDGATRGSESVYIEMPSNGLLNLQGTPDDQLPNSADGNQPYFTITGPSTLALDEADSRPDLGFNVYTLPAGDATITFHMVTPYWAQDYNDGIFVTVLPQQLPGNAIPMSAGWWDSNTNTYWAANGGPTVQALWLNDHLTTDLSVADLTNNVAKLGSNNPADVQAAQATLGQAIGTASAWEMNWLETAAITPNQQRAQNLYALLDSRWPMRFYYNASAHTLNFVGGPQWTIDQNHQYTIQITDGNAVAGVFLGGGGPLKIKTFFQNQLITPITVAPKSPTADDQLTVDILARVLVNGAWAVHFMTETFDFSALYGASPPDNQ